MTTFEHRSIIPATPEQVWAFHDQPNAFKLLTPPPIFVQVQRNVLTSLTSGEVEFTLWFAFIPARWHVRHEAGSTPLSFIDRALKSPVESWAHEHTMRPAPGGTELIDHIEITHKSSGFWAIFSRLFFSGLPLRFLFIYRHLRTRLGAPKMNPSPPTPLPRKRGEESSSSSGSSGNV